MATRVNGFGLTEVISDDHARGLAEAAMARVEAFMAREQRYGYLSDRDRRTLNDEFAEAERLLRETGDYKSRPAYQPFSATFTDADDEPELARQSREQARERAQAVLNVYRKITRGMETKSGESSHANTERKTVNCRLDRERDIWVVTGCGPQVEYADCKTAEQECRRRVALA